MGFPKKGSRGITVDGVRYRWVVSRVSRDFVQTVRVQHGEGHGRQLVWTRPAFRVSAAPITPRHVASIIRHGRHRGWVPDAPGADFVLEPGERPRHGEPSVDGDAMRVRMNFDPLRSRWPWPHHDPNLFPDFVLDGAINDKAIGSLFAAIAHYAEMDPAGSAADLLAVIAAAPADEGGDRWYLPAGVEVHLDGVGVLYAGCCADAESWVEWKALLEGGHEPWNGHDPFSTARLDDDAVVLVPGWDEPPVRVSIDTYRRLVGGLEADLKAFVGRAGRWLERHARPADAATITARLARQLHLVELRLVG